MWLGQGISSLGTGISQLAFPLLILALPNSSPAVAGFAGALERLPYVLFSLPAGALVDRWDRKRIMIICAIGLTLCITSIPIALLTGYLSILLIYLIAFTIGTLGLFYELAELAALTHVVPKTQLSAAVTQNEAVYSTVSLLAPSLSGLLFSIGRLLPFITDAISYLVLLGALLSMRIAFQEEHSEAPEHLLKQVREGMRWLWSHTIVRYLAFLAGYLYVVMSGSVLIILVIARQHQISSDIVGIILAVGGIGNLVGTALCTPFQKRIRFGRGLCYMLLLFVLLWPLYSLSSTPVFLGMVVAALALVDSIASILIASYRLTVIPDDLQGRVGSVYRLILFGSLTLGQALIGISLERLGVPITIAILWGGLILMTGITLINPPIRRASL